MLLTLPSLIIKGIFISVCEGLWIIFSSLKAISSVKVFTIFAFCFVYFYYLEVTFLIAFLISPGRRIFISFFLFWTFSLEVVIDDVIDVVFAVDIMVVVCCFCLVVGFCLFGSFYGLVIASLVHWLSFKIFMVFIVSLFYGFRFLVLISLFQKLIIKVVLFPYLFDYLLSFALSSSNRRFLKQL